MEKVGKKAEDVRMLGKEGGGRGEREKEGGWRGEKREKEGGWEQGRRRGRRRRRGRGGRGEEREEFAGVGRSWKEL